MRGSIGTMSSPSDAEQRLRDLARLRRVRDRIDREYAQPLDVEALARDAHMSAGHLSRQFRQAYGEAPYGCSVGSWTTSASPACSFSKMPSRSRVASRIQP